MTVAQMSATELYNSKINVPKSAVIYPPHNTAKLNGVYDPLWTARRRLCGGRSQGYKTVKLTANQSRLPKCLQAWSASINHKATRLLACKDANLVALCAPVRDHLTKFPAF